MRGNVESGHHEEKSGFSLYTNVSDSENLVYTISRNHISDGQSLALKLFVCKYIMPKAAYFNVFPAVPTDLLRPIIWQTEPLYHHLFLFKARPSHFCPFRGLLPRSFVPPLPQAEEQVQHPVY